MKILHISHHLGCFRDQQYILSKLGFEVTNIKFYDHVFTITQDVANNFWQSYRDVINSHDYVLITDTCPISRCILQNFDEFKSKLIIWITNRFDYGMIDDSEYYSLINRFKSNDRVKILASTVFEKIWCLKYGIDILLADVINPLGKFDQNLEHNIPNSTVFDEWYNNPSNIDDSEVYVPFYYNDNVFIKLADFLSSLNISVCNTTFKNPNQLKNFKAYITLPDAFSKFSTFENIHLHLPTILPSAKFLLKLSKMPGYLFNFTGYGGAEMLTEDLIKLIEWYDPKFNKCRLYFDAFEEIPHLINSIDRQSMTSSFIECSNNHENQILNKWKQVYESF